jgi:bifunctional DNA-binding transcriptional regulator/antitoxin component of YhaV-PrlF toxin-antitoxin module
MTQTLTLIDLGDEGVFLPIPKEVLARLGVNVGDELITTKTPDGVALAPSSDTRER